MAPIVEPAPWTLASSLFAYASATALLFLGLVGKILASIVGHIALALTIAREAFIFAIRAFILFPYYSTPEAICAPPPQRTGGVC